MSNSSNEQSTLAAPTADRERIAFYLAILTSLLHLYFNLVATWPDNYISAIHFMLFGSIILLTLPLRVGKLAVLSSVIDIGLFIGLIVSCGYLVLYSDALAARNYEFATADWIASFTAVLLALELVRRCMGWFIPMMILLAMSYVLFLGQYIDGVFHFAGLSAETILFRNYFDDGLFGPIAKISWTFVFMFILFGAFLVQAGTGDFIIRFANALVGRMVGGQGLVAVVSSGMMGSVSGSAIANTAATGVITIPLMKKAGFPAKFAAAVEAGASTGGQLIPPIMGAGVFVMASYTQIPYLTIIAAAFVPALLYFASIAIFVRIQATRLNIQPALESGQLSAWQELKSGWHHLLPIVLLVTLMIYGFTPTYAVSIATLSVCLFSLFSPAPMRWSKILAALANATENSAKTAILLVAIGMLVNCISISSLGVTFSLMINEWAGASLILLLVLIALASLIIGMGLPVTASYIVLATLSAPALYGLISQSALVEIIVNGQLNDTATMMMSMMAPALGEIYNQPNITTAQVFTILASLPPEAIDIIRSSQFDTTHLAMMLLSAHMIIFWLSQDSNVTPPVCLVAFTAAGIAKTPPMATGIEAWKTAKALYIVPLLFAYTPFIGGSNFEIMQVFFTALIGMYALVAAIYGYAEAKLNKPIRMVLALLGIALVWPHQMISVDIAAALCVIAVVIKQVVDNRLT
ncbi:TRAP transporter fused permease subunit [Pseudoalteromonas sp. L23]|uniref:TRAP transporter permease n=1 Tax=unclassified Pseudoalteromonas TaxID=194690 RepID=UPI001F2EF0B6|nr:MULTISPECIES: TRAP transporter fused permease subunit [unclassified Pseudoalteromonas]MCF2828889.1 TRAP transporter fused permease subunit [Pseudoalteromonas sp. OF5H-5]MCF2833868.1 TRAP transporter fused permease subunit [Pseudoalteromonas sp. DL2-H6]MCF2925809.1 TRAP transporter fused permease subunit [Pseudoalteromonas sp. DL2-H1]MCF7515699.1 TRAP transporter fused permease subunit [Pseudoalteromonas sp. L7]MCF7527741.1 TRAP transporter fused permease subunit [Pseudoalteromonas sp. L23]